MIVNLHSTRRVELGNVYGEPHKIGRKSFGILVYQI